MIGKSGLPGSELARLIPELRRRAPELPEPVAGEPETERYRLFEAVVGLLAEISNIAPAMLVLDDLQWADRPTLLLLRHLARSINPGRLLILGAYRTTETTTGGFAEALSDLRREGLVTQMPIRGLTEPETAQLVALQTGTVPSHSFVRELHAETEGNPFFIGEIVRHLSEAGVRTDLAGALEVQRVGLPEGVKEVIARRLARLDRQAIEWLRAAAVIGRDFDAGLLEQVLSFTEDEFLNVLDEALASSLVTEVPNRPGRYSFSHALIRETLYEGMSAPRRARIHRRVGEVLEARRSDRYLTSLALHFTRAAGAEDADKAIEYAQRAGEQASAMLAHEEAADHYARALEVQERFAPEGIALRCELLLLLGEARMRAGERPLARSTFREAATLAIELGDSSRLARAAIGASRRYIQPPGVIDEELITLLEQALAMTEGDRGVVRVTLLTRLCGLLYYSPRRDEMVELAAEATELAAELGDPEALALAAAARRRAFWDPDQLEQRLADSTELLTLARRAGDLELVLQGHAWLVVDLLEQGQPDAVQAQMQAFDEVSRRLRQPLYAWQASIWLAMRALLEGRLEDADRLAAEALAAGSHGETVTAPQYYAIQLLAIRREQDRMGELEQAARDLLATNPNRPAWRAALLTLISELGRIDEAKAEFEIAMRDFEQAPRDGDWLIAATLLADCAAELGDRERAATMYELMLPYRRGNVVIGLAAVCLGAAARYLGRLAHGRGPAARPPWSTSSWPWRATPPWAPRCTWPTHSSTTPARWAREPGQRSSSRPLPGRQPSSDWPTWRGVCRLCVTADRAMGLALGATLPRTVNGTKTLVIAEKPSVGRDLARVLPGAFAKHEGYLEGPEHIVIVGRRPSRPARRPRRVRRPVQEVADGRPADRPRPLQARRPRRALEEADERGQAPARPRRRRRRRQRLRRRARGRADLRLPVREVRIQEAGQAAVAELDDDRGDQGRLRAAARRLGAGHARGRGALAQRGRLDRRHERHPRGDDPPALELRRRGLAGPRADADAGDPGPPRAGDPRLQARALLGRRRRVRPGRRTGRGSTRAAITPAPTHASRAPTRPRRSSTTAQGQIGEITKLEKTERKERAPLLYDLTSLQRDANSRFGFSARRTLAAAQRLYEEHKALTYPRTNSRFLTRDMIPEIKPIARLVGEQREYAQASEYVLGLDVLPLGRVVNDEKVTDHHAIIPTRAERHPVDKMNDDDRRIYDLVVRRFLAVFHPDAVFENTRVETTVADRRRSGSRVPHPRQADAGSRLARGLRRDARQRALATTTRVASSSCPSSSAASAPRSPRSPPRRRRPSRPGATPRARCWPRWRPPASWSTRTSCARR